MVAVIVFEVLLNATSMFNHGNVRLPARARPGAAAGSSSRRTCTACITPSRIDETNSNFGFNLPWWDRLFGTYRAQPRAGHEAMTIGIRTFRDRKLVHAGFPACWRCPSSARSGLCHQPPSWGSNS